MEEIWKPIPHYEGLYEVSSLGRVRALDRFLTFNCNGREQTQLFPGHMVSTYPDRGSISPLNGSYYLMLCLNKNGKPHRERVHRLVALAFIPNPDHLPCVNHKDEDKLNNSIDNLEWCSYEYNNAYGTAQERGHKTRIETGVYEKTSERMRENNPSLKHTRQVMCIETGEVFNSVAEATRAIRAHKGNITNAIKLGQKCKGYTFKYINGGK